MKKIISVFLSICICLCLFTPVCFADDSVYDHTHNWVKEKIHSYSLEYNGVAFGIDVFKCSECALYLHTLKFLGYEVPVIRASPDTALGSEAAAMCAQAMVAIFGKEWYATKFEAGGGSASPGGVGRHPSGYVNDNGTPTYDSAGEFQLIVYPEVKDTQSIFPDYFKLPAEFEFTSSSPYKESSHWKMDGMNYYGMSVSSDYSSGTLETRFVIDAPVSGLYYIKNEQDITSTYKSGWFGKLETKRYYLAKGAFSYYLAKDTSKIVYNQWVEIKLTSIGGELSTNRVTFYPIVVNVIPDTPVKKQTNITINNNTFNGNIYVDNTNKLTYIYPQYTVNNETKISNNPIIYNEETKQYYTYDQTTNNYYYITYGEPAPTPTPSPSPDPGGSTPDPGKPTPTPTPGGSDSSGDGSGSNPFKWLGELFKDILEGILKGLWKIITSIFGFVLWLLSLLFKLFPWMPNSALVALCGGVVVVTIIRIIKFITGR